MSTTNPIFSAVIASYDRHSLLEGTIRSLLQQDLDPALFEIIVVDNSPDQNAAERFGNRYSGIANLRYLLEPVPGAANARNKGVEAARGRIAGFIDDDAVAAPDWMRQIIAAFESYGSRAGSVGGRILPRWTAPRPVWISDKLLGYLTIVDWGGSMRELGSGEWLAACNLAFDREAYAAAGGIAPDLDRIGSGMSLLSNGEMDLCNRIATTGRAAIYAPAAVVEHIIDPARLTRSWFRRRAAWQAVSDFIMDPRAASKEARSRAFWLRVRQALLPRHILPGFFQTTDKAKTFDRELFHIRILVLALLSGGREFDAGKGYAALVRRMLRFGAGGPRSNSALLSI